MIINSNRPTQNLRQQASNVGNRAMWGGQGNVWWARRRDDDVLKRCQRYYFSFTGGGGVGDVINMGKAGSRVQEVEVAETVRGQAGWE